MRDDEPLRVTEPGAETQELRLAIAMAGGVSLAIWMGGVARELNLLQRASRQRASVAAASPTVPPTSRPPDPSAKPDSHVQALYLRLLELLDMTVETDVLAGTSAGGINAALLGLARVNHLDLMPLRDIWLAVGGFEDLLRDPSADKPPSLLKGDEGLLVGLRDGIEQLWPVKQASPADDRPETRVFMTTTLLAGETSRFTDAYGTLVQDVDHHGMFTFGRDQLADPANVPAIALAARSSASFPLAFEPAYLALGQEGVHAAMGQHANITRSHWAADGGLLMNRPINPLLQEIFDRPADRQVRRVLLYVTPTSGPDPNPLASPETASPDSPLTAVDALSKDLGAVLGQSIAADLRAFREHSDRVDALVDTRLRMAELAIRLCPPDARLLTAKMLSDYRARQSEWFARPIVSALMRAITALPSVPPAWVDDLGPGSGIEARCLGAAAAAACEGWSEQPPSELRSLAAFGPAAYEGAKATVIGILRSAFVRAADADQRAQLGQALDVAHNAIRFSRPDVQQFVNAAIAAQADGSAPEGLAVVAANVTRAYASRLTPLPPPTLSDAWTKLGELLGESQQPGEPGVRTLLDALAPGDGAATELRTYLDYLPTGAEPVALALFDLHAATRSVLPVAVEIEQPIELVQLSADTRTLLDGARTTAAQKLTGMQLHHFGALYKPSWRASDWAWGRVDGAGWLIHLLLDPRRLRAVAERREPDGRTPGQWWYDELRTRVLMTAGGAPDDASLEAAVRGELAFLDKPGSPDPKSLPNTSLWVSRTCQRWIAAAELPVVAHHILATPSARGGTPASESARWAREVLELAGPAGTAQAASELAAWLVAHDRGTLRAYRLAERAVAAAKRAPAPPAPPSGVDPIELGQKLEDCPIPDEKLTGELGQPLFTRTVTKAAAVGAALAAGTPRFAAVLGPVLTTVRTITLGGYRASAATGGWPRTFLLIGFVALALGALAGIQHSAILGVGGLVLSASGAYVIAVATWGRSRKLWVALPAITVCGAVFAVSIPLREDVFGKGRCTAKCDPTTIGWFGTEVLPWLNSTFWHVLLVAVSLVILISLAGAAFGRKSAAGR